MFRFRARDKSLPTYTDVLEKIGCGLAQLRMTFIAGSVWLADGAEILLVTTATKAVTDLWDLSPMQRGAIVTVVFIGILVGNLLSGYLGDKFGRRPPILISFMCIVLFSILSSCAVDFTSLFMARLFVGMAFGVGQPAFQCLQTEVTPAYWRLCVCGLGAFQFTLGEIYSGVLILVDDPTMEVLHWRWLLRMGALPAGLFGLAALVYLKESPLWLALEGRYDDAKKVLRGMRDTNGSGDFEVDFAPVGPEDVPEGGADEHGFAKNIETIFGRHYALTTIITTFSCFVLNFTFYGCLYAFPQVIGDIGMSGSPAEELIVGALWEFPGQALGLVCGTLMKRKHNMKVYLFFNTASIICFATAMPVEHRNLFVSASLYFGYYGIKFFTCLGWLAIYQYAAEVFPTSCRTTGTSICMSGGRVAGMVAPVAFELLAEKTGGFASFFTLTASLAAVNFLLIDLLPYETYGAALEEQDSDPQGLVASKGYGAA